MLELPPPCLKYHSAKRAPPCKNQNTRLGCRPSTKEHSRQGGGAQRGQDTHNTRGESNQLNSYSRTNPHKTNHLREKEMGRQQRRNTEISPNSSPIVQRMYISHEEELELGLDVYTDGVHAARSTTSVPLPYSDRFLGNRRSKYTLLCWCHSSFVSILPALKAHDECPLHRARRNVQVLPSDFAAPQ